MRTKLHLNKERENERKLGSTDSQIDKLVQRIRQLRNHINEVVGIKRPLDILADFHVSLHLLAFHTNEKADVEEHLNSEESERENGEEEEIEKWDEELRQHCVIVGISVVERTEEDHLSARVELVELVEEEILRVVG